MNSDRSFRSLAASGIAYHALETGNGPSLLFLHGFTGHGLAYPGFHGKLAANCRITAVDLPGHGGTSLPAHVSTTFTAVAEDLVILAGRALSKPVHCIGYSMGGRLALAVACRAPGLFATLSLIGASPGIQDEHERVLRANRDADLAKYIRAVPRQAFQEYWRRLPLFDGDWQSPPTCSRRRSELARSLMALGAGMQPSFWDELDSLPLPVLLIYGSRDSKYRRISLSMRKKLRHGSTWEAPEAGHRAHVDRPLTVARRILDFIHETEG